MAGNRDPAAGRRHLARQRPVASEGGFTTFYSCFTPFHLDEIDNTLIGI